MNPRVGVWFGNFVEQFTSLGAKRVEGAEQAGYTNAVFFLGVRLDHERDFLRDVQIAIGDLFRDLQEEFQNWEASASSQGKPKSLWEELAEIGEEFVEFLEKELNITDTEFEANDYGPQKDSSFSASETERKGGVQNEGSKGSGIKDNIDEIEATLAKLKKELGL
ncbi:hypothetical protein GH714_035375 [Hevea brasiliensis]|uniref:Uncharacterized protein n=1 Tax=Hevea brasiliensis TaxID=3981 RepID=A0A6A6KT71_HEVBR|nr:hypothetical protein GH714_035375 [Hevea brasiliensis]